MASKPTTSTGIPATTYELSFTVTTDTCPAELLRQLHDLYDIMAQPLWDKQAREAGILTDAEAEVLINDYTRSGGTSKRPMSYYQRKP